MILGSKSSLLQKFKNVSTVEKMTVAALILFGLLFDSFFSFKNIVSILETAALKGVLALGMTILMISGELDLSVGTTAALSGILFGGIVHLTGGTITGYLLAFAAVICMAFLIATFNAWLTISTKIPSLLTTLATSKILYCIAGLAANKLFREKAFPNWFKNLAGDWFGVLPGTVGIFFFFAFVFSIVLKKTRFGRNVYAIGGNKEASRLSGIKTNATIYKTFLLVQLSAAVSGLILAAYQGSASHNYAQDWAMDVVCSAIIGGASYNGGFGSIKGTCFGLFFIGIMNNALIYIRAGVFPQYLFSGLLMLIVATINYKNNRQQVHVEDKTTDEKF